MRFVALQWVSGAGKTTLASFLAQEGQQIYVVSLDWYYKQWEEIDQYPDKQVLDALDSEQFLVDMQLLYEQSILRSYRYDFVQKQRTLLSQGTISNDATIIVEGLHSFDLCQMAGVLKVFLHKPLHWALLDRMQRDFDPTHPEKKIKPLDQYLHHVKTYLLPFCERMTSQAFRQADVIVDVLRKVVELSPQVSEDSFILLLQQRNGNNRTVWFW